MHHDKVMVTRYSAKDIFVMRKIVRDLHCIETGMNTTQISVTTVEDQLKTYIMAGVTPDDLRSLRDQKEGMRERAWA